MRIKNKIRQFLPPEIYCWIKKKVLPVEETLRVNSIHRALTEQKLYSWYNRLISAVPDISRQYNTFVVDSGYLQIKVRALHAFQISLVKKALEFFKARFGSENLINIIDIGDSAGTHTQYIKLLFQDYSLNCLSVDVDSRAVEKIRSKGLNAVCSRAEDLTSLPVKADMFLSFEVLEHLMNPCGFLRDLSKKSNCRVFVITVPYMRKSRVGLYHIREGQGCSPFFGNTHIFELSPCDWRLLFTYSGWKVEAEKIYLQYPRRSLDSFLLKPYWERRDFEGFYGAILTRNPS